MECRERAGSVERVYGLRYFSTAAASPAASTRASISSWLRCSSPSPPRQTSATFARARSRSACTCQRGALGSNTRDKQHISAPRSATPPTQPPRRHSRCEVGTTRTRGAPARVRVLGGETRTAGWSGKRKSAPRPAKAMDLARARRRASAGSSPSRRPTRTRASPRTRPAARRRRARRPPPPAPRAPSAPARGAARGAGPPRGEKIG